MKTARLRHALGALALLSSCGTYRPALFADRTPVTKMDDERPIPLPSRDTFDERVYLSDVYLRRPLFDFVRPVDFSTGGDVNALDEVPPSSWFAPDQERQVPRPTDPQGPVFPLLALDESPTTNDDALVVRDARGFRYELLVDPPDHPGLYTGAEVLGGILLRSLGWRAPLTWLAEVPDAVVHEDSASARPRLIRWLARKTTMNDRRRHVSATQWPPGVDIGVTPDFSRRTDDANDTVDHHNRRTLRALKIVAHWMGWSGFDVESMRDVYVGVAGHGYLRHYVVGTSSAFGTHDLQGRPKVDEEAGSEWWHFITLGLSKPVVRPARVSAYPSLGYLPGALTPGEFELSPPYSPFVRLTPPDEYWVGKRLLDAGEDAIRIGIEAAALPYDAADHLEEVLETRRQTLIAHALSVVTPLDVAASVGRTVWLRDRGIGAGVADPKGSSYEVSFIDSYGVALAPRIVVPSAGELTVVTLPGQLTSGLVVLHIRALRRGAPSPRWCDVHVMIEGVAARVIGIRH